MSANTAYFDPTGQIAAHSGDIFYGGGGSSVVWNTTGADWWVSGSTDVAWNNSNADTAMFTGSGVTVTLSAGIQAGEVDFIATGYDLESGSLSIGGSGVIDTSLTVTATIGWRSSGRRG